MPETERRETDEKRVAVSRRKLVKRLALIAATGYVAPKANLVSEAWACHQKSNPFPHPGGTGC